VSFFTVVRDFAEGSLGGSAIAGVVGGTIGGAATVLAPNAPLTGTVKTIGGAIAGIGASVLAPPAAVAAVSRLMPPAGPPPTPIRRPPGVFPGPLSAAQRHDLAIQANTLNSQLQAILQRLRQG